LEYTPQKYDSVLQNLLKLEISRERTGNDTTGNTCRLCQHEASGVLISIPNGKFRRSRVRTGNGQPVTILNQCHLIAEMGGSWEELIVSWDRVGDNGLVVWLVAHSFYHFP
jgi:hypothetical protein